MQAPISECPHCSKSEGYFVKDYLSGRSQTRFTGDGAEGDNSGIYDSLNHKSGKYAYRISCEKRLFKLEEVED